MFADKLFHINQAIKARGIMRRDKDYVVSFFNDALSDVSNACPKDEVRSFIDVNLDIEEKFNNYDSRDSKVYDEPLRSFRKHDLDGPDDKE